MAKQEKKEVSSLKIEFLKSPTGKFNMGYSMGDIAEFDTKQAEILIEAGYAKKV